MAYFLEARNVVKQYAHHKALNDVSITVPEGKIFGLLGPNGAGKTTLIRIINHITAPDSGEIIFDGRSFEENDIERIGYLPEERGLYPKMKVGEQAVYLARLKGLTEKEAVKRLKEWFDKFGIMPWWNKKLEELSKGMQQKVQFIITVLHRPNLLIFDEPFSGFDPVNSDLLKKEILELKKAGHTIIFSTHNMPSVEEVCDEIALINRSKVVLSGEVSLIKREHGTGVYELITSSSELLQLPTQCTLIERAENSLGMRYLIKKDRIMTNNELLSQLLQQVPILKYAECLPSMHDIFLQTVQNSSEEDENLFQ